MSAVEIFPIGNVEIGEETIAGIDYRMIEMTGRRSGQVVRVILQDAEYIAFARHLGTVADAIEAAD